MINKVLVSCAVCLVLTFSASAQSPKDSWVDSVFNQMTVEDKIAQLFLITIDVEKESEINGIENRIRENTLGGILLKKVSNPAQATWITRLQSGSKIPLLVGADNPSGLGLNLNEVLTFPNTTAVGAIDHDSLVFLMGREVARQMDLMGIHLQFIPSNIATQNTENSFGEDSREVAAKALAYWKGLQSGNALACTKYFPIQGVSVTQVQKGLPGVELAVDSMQAYPFKVLFKNKIPALMAESAALPLFYTEKKTALKNIFSSNTLSAAFAGDWIRKNMNYEGLIMVDIKKMVSSSDKFGAGDAEVFAFQAGNDMLITDDQPGAGIRKMRRLLRRQKEFIPQLDRSVKKILALKYDAGLGRKNAPSQTNISQKLATIESKLLERRLYEAAPTVIRNQQNTLPIQSLESKKFICLVADDTLKGNLFSSFLSKYVQTAVIQIDEKKDLSSLTDTLQRQQVIVVAVFPETRLATLNKLLPIAREPQINQELIVCDFGSSAFKQVAHNFPTIITGYFDDQEMVSIIPQIIFGGLAARGTLPVSFGQIPASQPSPKTISLDRLSYSFPEDAGMDAKTLDKIETIAREAIDIKGTPGCHVLVARKGKIIYERSFGHLTYEKQLPVTDNTIYDLASVTKVTATLQTVMFMYEKGLIDINKKASFYLPELKTSNKKDFTLKDILTHQAGLWPFLPFWAQTMKDSLHMPEYYNTSLSREYPYVVADNLFATATMKDSLWHWIVNAKIREKAARTPFDYRYSDMGFYILQHLAEKLLNQPIQDFLDQNLYEPLGAYTMGYLPLLRFPVQQIAPTENDKLFRKALLIGTVHDQGAAMHGGIAGHAGLFSTANDLAKLGQMLLQQGQYGGIQYYRPETIRFFTQKQFENSRRGLGWDKPMPGDWNSPTALQASMKTFGHTGFTGTCVWVDPEFDLVYIFLSNRVHPDMTNNKLLNANIRTRIQEVVYQSIFNYCKTAGSDPEIPLSEVSDALGRSK
jgi:beta-N-acetylhexosaminidase